MIAAFRARYDVTERAGRDRAGERRVQGAAGAAREGRLRLGPLRMAEIFAYTDGACSGNPGPGGWGAVLVARDGDAGAAERELSGGEALTTNNRMELMAAIAALEALERPAALTVVTDSAYLRDGVTAGSTAGRRNGWRTADKKPVKNEDLWRRLDAAAARHTRRLGLGQGPRRPPRERARRRARPPGDGAVQAECGGSAHKHEKSCPISTS